MTDTKTITIALTADEIDTLEMVAHQMRERQEAETFAGNGGTIVRERPWSGAHEQLKTIDAILERASSEQQK